MDLQNCKGRAYKKKENQNKWISNCWESEETSKLFQQSTNNGNQYPWAKLTLNSEDEIKPHCYSSSKKSWKISAYRCNKHIPDHLQAVPLCHSARQCNLEQEVALQDLTHTVEDHLQFPVAEQSGFNLGQGLLVMLTEQTG